MEHQKVGTYHSIVNCLSWEQILEEIAVVEQLGEVWGMLGQAEPSKMSLQQRFNEPIDRSFT